MVLPVIALRFALFADLMVLAGLAAFALYALTPGERSRVLPLAHPAAILALLGLLFSTLAMLVLTATMMGTGVRDLDPGVAWAVITQSSIGKAWIVRTLAMIAAIISTAFLTRSPGAYWLLLASTALAIVTLVWTGHAGATEGWAGTLHRLSDSVHMLAASVWIGGLAAFAWLLFRGVPALPVAHRTLGGFARVGTIAVALIIVTGLFNSLILLGLPSPAALLASTYGWLLLLKIGLFAAMLLLATVNRWRLTPALSRGLAEGNPAPALADLRRSLALESAAAVAILAVVAWLGTLEPAR